MKGSNSRVSLVGERPYESQKRGGRKGRDSMSGEYPIAKNIVLNSIYDSLERMDFVIRHTDSGKGRILFEEKHEGADGSIQVSPMGSTERKLTRVEIQGTLSYDAQLALLDEIGADIEKYMDVFVGS